MSHISEHLLDLYLTGRIIETDRLAKIEEHFFMCGLCIRRAELAREVCDRLRDVCQPCEGTRRTPAAPHPLVFAKQREKAVSVETPLPPGTVR